jgi:hypothetical protein
VTRTRALAFGRYIGTFILGGVAAAALTMLATHRRDPLITNLPTGYEGISPEDDSSRPAESREAWLARRLDALEQALGSRPDDAWARQTEPEVQRLIEANADLARVATFDDVYCVRDLCRVRLTLVDAAPRDNRSDLALARSLRAIPLLHARRFQHCTADDAVRSCLVYFVKRGAEMPLRPERSDVVARNED